MTSTPQRRAVLGAAAGAAIAAARPLRLARAQTPLRLRCSLDTAPSHLRNVSIADFLAKLEKTSGGRIKTELFQSGALFPDLAVSKALVQGQVEMACPGLWTLTGFVPDADMCQLPIFYGQSSDIVHKAFDGKPGELLNQEITAKLGVQVLGKWLDLGFQNWFTTTKPINTLADLKGLKLRSSGGVGVPWRIAFVGGIANTTAWPQVPLALSQGTFDGLVSSDESCASAQLWDAGLRYAFEDHQFFADYIPLVSNAFWDKLPPDLQQAMRGLWADNIAAYRAEMIEAQRKARTTMEAHGVKFVDPSPDALASARRRMLIEQDEMARQAKISPEMVALVMQTVGRDAG